MDLANVVDRTLAYKILKQITVRIIESLLVFSSSAGKLSNRHQSPQISCISNIFLIPLLRLVKVVVCLRLCSCPVGGLGPLGHHLFCGNINLSSSVPTDRLLLVLLRFQ